MCLFCISGQIIQIYFLVKNKDFNYFFGTDKSSCHRFHGVAVIWYLNKISWKRLCLKSGLQAVSKKDIMRPAIRVVLPKSARWKFV